jgi:two-component system sensor histidine kinase PilS (NtrC family)
LSAHIAHEVKNPLASISGSVQLISQGGGVRASDKKLLDIIERETSRLNGLINDFLAYARPSQPLKIPVMLRQLIQDMIPLLAADPRFAGVTIDNNCPEQLNLPVDRDQIRQVFWNLFINAADAMPDGGYIKIDAGFDKETLNRQNKIEIVVSDTGKGMTGEEMESLFEPFFTTKEGGSGLGLATVYRIIESHGGTISVDSTLNVGTAFTIILPVE